MFKQLKEKKSDQSSFSFLLKYLQIFITAFDERNENKINKTTSN